MTMSEARELIAAAVTAGLVGFNVTAGPPRMPKVMDGWVIVRQVKVSDTSMTAADVDFEVVLLVSAAGDAARGELAVDEHSIAFLNAVAALPVADITVDPATVPVGGSAFLALVATFTMEV